MSEQRIRKEDDTLIKSTEREGSEGLIPPHVVAVRQQRCEALQQLTGWPWHQSELGDLYHRIRAWPPDTGRWRRRMVDAILRGDARLIPSTAASRADIQQRLDAGIAHLREITRILAVLYGTPDLGAEGDTPFVDAQVVKMMARLSPYRDFGLDLHQLPQKNIADLIPPALHHSLNANMRVHSREVCLAENPRCDTCEIRKFCAHYRRQMVATARDSEAPTFIDLFAGAGGLSTGLVQAGCRPLLALDQDPLACQTYRLNHPEIPDEDVICGDIREIPIELIQARLGDRRLDILAGAPPCQGFSVAGMRSRAVRMAETLRGYSFATDQRNYLYQYLVGAARVLRPRVVLMENVPGMDTRRRGGRSFMEEAAHLLGECSYRTAIWRMDASAHGVPQRRQRCILVATDGDTLPARPMTEYQDPQASIPDPDALPPVSLEAAIFDLPEIPADGGQMVVRREGPSLNKDRRARFYLTRQGSQITGGSGLIFNHRARYNNDRDLELYALLAPGENSVDAIERHGREDLMRYRVDVFDDKYQRLRSDQPCKTIVAHLAKDGNSYIHPTQVRTLTVREGARVQTFPDDFLFCGSPSGQWVQLGNAVPPLLARQIGRTIVTHLRRQKKP